MITSSMNSPSTSPIKSIIFPKWFSKLTTTTTSPKCQAIKKPKPAMFGIDLSSLIDLTGTTVPLLTEPDILVHLPQLINCCSNHILTYGHNEVGIFRINGNNKRMESLQKEFGKDPKLSFIDSSQYSCHDVAGVLTRFLSNLPNSLIPQNFYDPLRYTWLYLEKEEDRIEAFVDCLTRLPYQNRHLLMYILNFLSLLSMNEEHTQMGAGNLSSIFQPSILSHPQHLLQPKEYLISQKVLEYMIVNHKSFLKILSTEYDLTPSRRTSRSSINMKDINSRRKCRNFAPEFSPTRSLTFPDRYSRVSSVLGDGSSFSIISESSSSSNRSNSMRSKILRQSIMSTTSCPHPVQQKTENFVKRSSSKLSPNRFGGWWDQVHNRLSLKMA